MVALYEICDQAAINPVLVAKWKPRKMFAKMSISVPERKSSPKISASHTSTFAQVSTTSSLRAGTFSRQQIALSYCC